MEDIMVKSTFRMSVLSAQPMAVVLASLKSNADERSPTFNCDQQSGMFTLSTSGERLKFMVRFCGLLSEDGDGWACARSKATAP